MSANPSIKPAQPTDRSSSSHWLFRGAVGLCVLVSAGMAVFVFSKHSVPEIQQFRTGLQRWQSWLTAWRLVLLGVLIGGYPYWVRLATPVLKLDGHQQQRVLAQRWPVTVIFVVVEIAFGQHGLETLVEYVRDFFNHPTG